MQSTKRSVFPLKKSIALIMALSVLVCGVFAACSSKKTDGQNSAADTTQAGLANADTEFGTEINKDGKEVDVVYEKDKKGKNHAYEINKNGEKVTKSNGDYVEVPIEDDKNNILTGSHPNGNMGSHFGADAVLVLIAELVQAGYLQHRCDALQILLVENDLFAAGIGGGHLILRGFYRC